jgi:hypothetical protein
MANDPSVTIDSVSTDVPSGGTTNLKYTITNNNDNGGGPQAVAQVSVNGMSCTGDCGAVVPIEPGQSVTRTARLTAPQVDPGQIKTITVQITAKISDGSFTASQRINVRGADKPQTVRQISGRVKDGNGRAISGAAVGLKDSAGRDYKTNTNADGGYVFTSSDAQPIATGSIIVGAAKQGYQTVTVTVQGGADKSINVPLTLQSLIASPSATPSAAASATADPTAEATDATEPTEAPAATVPDSANTASSQGGGGSLLYIILGGLLVAAGIGAIVLVLMRRKNDDPEDPDDADGFGGPAGVVPPSHGRFVGADPTRVGAPVGGPGNDATMIANLPGQRSVSDAPTMMQRAVPAEDEFPDPYGAPAVTPGNYAAPGGWGTTSAAAAGTYGAGAAGQATGTYGGNPYGAGPAIPAQPTGYEDNAGYGAGQYSRSQPEDAYGAYSAGQYADGGQQRFDEPTGMYRPEPQGGYQDAGGYPDAYQDAGGYQGGGYDEGGQSGYGRPAYDQAGYPVAAPEPEYQPPTGGRGAEPYQGGGYQGGAYGGPPEPPAEQGGGYGSWSNNAPDRGGNAYGAPAGGYDQRGVYGAPPGGGSGYPADQGGYDQRGGGYGRPDGGYEQGGRGQQPGGGGYGEDPGGYYGGAQPESGGRHGGQSRQQPPPPPESTHPGQRRSLDWLDD